MLAVTVGKQLLDHSFKERLQIIIIHCYWYTTIMAYLTIGYEWLNPQNFERHLPLWVVCRHCLPCLRCTLIINEPSKMSSLLSQVESA